MKRLSFDISLFLSILLLPWWISAILALAGLFLFIEYYEFILGSVFLYGLYMTPGIWVISSSFFYSLSIAIVYLVIQVLRRYIILYKNEIPY